MLRLPCLLAFMVNILYFWLSMEKKELKIENLRYVEGIWGMGMENGGLRIENSILRIGNWGWRIKIWAFHHTTASSQGMLFWGPKSSKFGSENILECLMVLPIELIIAPKMIALLPITLYLVQTGLSKIEPVTCKILTCTSHLWKSRSSYLEVPSDMILKI